MEFRPKKSLGQHFLTSRHTLEEIISASTVKKDENILEIGPGTGILTRALLKTGARVTAIEKDERSFALLNKKFAKEIQTNQLDLIHGDILENSLSDFQEKRFAVVANIPYYITGAILRKFLEDGPRPERMILLVQREVAERIVARDGKESILSVSVKAFGTPRIVAKVPRGAFSPPPAVDSAILSISDISDARFREKKIEIARFFEILRAGFGQKRKFLMRNLESVLDQRQVQAAWSRIGLDAKARAEDISATQWFEICDASAA